MRLACLALLSMTLLLGTARADSLDEALLKEMKLRHVPGLSVLVTAPPATNGKRAR